MSEPTPDPAAPGKGQFLVYEAEDGRVKIDVRLADETLWLPQAQLASHVATRFRIWATQRLKEYIVKGFTLDDERLKNPQQPFDYFEELTRRIQDIRTSERRFYQKITDIYGYRQELSGGRRTARTEQPGRAIPDLRRRPGDAPHPHAHERLDQEARRFSEHQRPRHPDPCRENLARDGAAAGGGRVRAVSPAADRRAVAGRQRLRPHGQAIDGRRTGKEETMNMTPDDGRLLAELCEQHGVSADKVRKLLDAVRDYEFKDRRTGVYEALREILKSKPATKTERPA